MASRWVIPSDHTEEDGYLAVFFCVPNSRQWRGLVTAHLHTLAYGRAWDEQTGSIKDVQKTAREVLASMSMCDLERLTVAIENISVSLEEINQKTLEQITLGELLDDLEDNPAAASLASFIPLLEFLIVIRDLIPTVALKADATPIIGKILDMVWWKGPILGHLKAMNVSLGAMALGTLGSGATSFLRLLGTGFENAANLWYQTIKGTGDFMGWWDALYDWWHGEGEPEPPSDVEKSMLANVYNDVFVEGDTMSVDVDNFITVDGCCGGMSGSLDTEAGSSTGSVPSGMLSPDGTITDRQCKAAHYIVDQIQAQLWALEVNPPPDWYDLGDTEGYLRDIGNNSSFGNLLTAVYGSYSDLASAIFGGSPDYAVIHDDIENNYDALVCALSKADDAFSARVAFLDKLTVSGNDLDFVSGYLYNLILNLLWWQFEGLEAEIANYTTIVDCGACLDCVDYWVASGTELASNLADVQSVDGGANDYINVLFDYDAAEAQHCPPGVTINSITVLSGVVYTNTNQGYRIYNDAGTLVYASNTPPSAPLTNIGKILLTYQGTGTFRVSISWVDV